MLISFILICNLIYMSVFWNDVSGERVIICERQRQLLSCDPPGVLSIQQSNYGRTLRKSANICDHHSIHDNDCRERSSLEIVRAICEGKTSCLLYAGSSVFGETCPKTHKYLEVNYTCEGQRSMTTTSAPCCCTSGYTINIIRTEELRRKLQEIKTKLTVPQNSTSAYRRRLISATDERPSAALTGHIFGTVVLGTVTMSIILIDLLPRLCKRGKK